MKALRAAGFTLIELLTVIAIIAILAGLTAVVLPGVLERAKITDAVADMRAISTSLQSYYTEQGTFPPGYGYMLFNERAFPVPDAKYNHEPYTLTIGIDGARDWYDRFSQDYDTNENGVLERLEYIPVKGDAYLNKALTDLPYPAGGALQAVGEVPGRTRTQRPYVYVPYAKKDVERMRRIVRQKSADGKDEWDGAVWDADFITSNTLFPPAQYDGFVLISVGPLENTRGLLTPPGDEEAWLAATGETLPERAYYVLGMRAAYLATRDGNEDGELDFDYLARTRKAQQKAYPGMPDLQNKGIAAPIIWKSQ